MIDFDGYKVPVPYPDKPAKPHLASASAKDARAYADQMDKYEQDMVVYRQMLADYRAASAVVEARYREDVLVEAGLKGHPKADKVFAMAWDECHSGAGYRQDVYNRVLELAELVLP